MSTRTPAPGKPDFEREGADWPNRAASRFVEAAGLCWHVQMFGEQGGTSAPSILLLHGAGAATHSWRDVAPALAASARVIAPDLPGHGFTQTPPSRGLALPAMAASLLRLLDAIGVGPVIVVGHSAGAAVALRMALDEPERVRGVIGINAALRPFPGAAGQVFPWLAQLLFMNPVVPHVFAFRARDPAAVDRLLRQTGSTIDAFGVALYARLFRTPGHVAATLGMMSHWDLASLAAAFPNVAVPVHLVAGLKDRAVPANVSDEAAARIPGARRTDWAGLGHLAHEERPDLAIALIAEGMRSLAA